MTRQTDVRVISGVVETALYATEWQVCVYVCDMTHEWDTRVIGGLVDVALCATEW